MKAIVFVRDGHFVNLSRVSPSELQARPIAENRCEITVNNRTAICVMPGMIVRTSRFTYIHERVSIKGAMLVPQTLEYARYYSTIAEVARATELVGPLWGNILTFATKNDPDASSYSMFSSTGFSVCSDNRL